MNTENKTVKNVEGFNEAIGTVSQMNGTYIGEVKQSPVFIKSEGKSIREFVSDIEENMIVLGRVGKGKTRVLKEILMRASNQYKIKVLDGGNEFGPFETVIAFKQQGFLSPEEQEQCKQADIIIIDETMKWYNQDPNQFMVFIKELRKANTRIIASFQEVPPPELIETFKEYVELNL